MKKVPVIDVNTGELINKLDMWSKTRIPGWEFNDAASFRLQHTALYVWLTQKRGKQKGNYEMISASGPACRLSVYGDETEHYWVLEAYEYNANNPIIKKEFKSREQALKTAVKFMKNYKVKE